MNNSRAEKLSKVVSAKVTPEDYKLCKRIAAKLFENGEIQRESVSELVRLLVGNLVSEYRLKYENMDRYFNKNKDIKTKGNLENNNKMQFPMEQQPFTMPYSLISTQEYQTYEQLEQQKERKKQEHNQTQLYEIMSRMPELPTIPSNSKQTSKVRSI